MARIKADATFDGQTYTMHSATASADETKRIASGKITKEVNCSDSFTFKIFPSNVCFDYIESMRTDIWARELNGGVDLFHGRVINVTHAMDASGAVYKDVTCEGDLGRLHDGVCEPVSIVSGHMSSAALQTILNNYNTTATTQFNYGEHTIAGLYGTVDTDYCSAFDAVQSIMIDGFGGEVRARYEDKKYYLDYTPTAFGETSDTAIKLAVNMKSLSQTTDASELITRLYPYGADNGKGTRLTIAPATEAYGKKYIQDDELVEKYGIISAVKTYNDIGVGWYGSEKIVSYAEKLYKQAKTDFESLKTVTKRYQVSALDLSVTDASFEIFQLYNTYYVYNKLMNISAYLRVVGITYDLANPQNSTLTFETV